MEAPGRGYRRVVASPEPMVILEEKAIEALANSGYVVVCVGGGGIPVYRNKEGYIVGIEAVIDKDFASALLATNIKADLFLISTSVKQVCLNFGKPDEKALSSMTLIEAKQYLKEGHFAPGSMAPKIEAIIRYLERGGTKAIVTSPAGMNDALEGKTGTQIVPL